MTATFAGAAYQERNDRAYRFRRWLNQWTKPALEAIDQPVRGIDVSKWQGEIDWDTVKEKGIDFAIIRAGSVSGGGEYEDIQFKRNAKEAQRVGIPVGYYWYYRPGYNSITQANFFADLIEGQKYDIYPVCDIEENNGLDPYEVASRLWVFCDRLEKRAGKPTMIYTNPSFAFSRIAKVTWLKDKILWIAHWGVEDPYVPYQWRNYGKTWTFWQTHVGQDGKDHGMESGGLDHNVYNGTWEDFQKEFFLVEPPPPPPPPGVDATGVTVHFSDGSTKVFGDI